MTADTAHLLSNLPPQVVQSIKDLSTKFDQNNTEIQRKLNKTANDVAWIRGYLDKEEKSND